MRRTFWKRFLRFRTLLVLITFPSDRAVIDVYRDAQLSEEERDGIWTLFEKNMRSLCV